MANNKTNGYDDEEMTVELELDDGQTVNCAIITILTVKEQDYIGTSFLWMRTVIMMMEKYGSIGYAEDENDPNAEPELGYIDNDDEYDMVADAFDEYLDNAEFDEIVKDEE